MQGATGGAALLLQAPRGAPSTGANSGRCAQAHAVRAGGPVRALPPPLGGGGAAMMTMGRGLHRARAPRWRPQGVWGPRAAAMEGQRGRTPDPGHPVLPPQMWGMQHRAGGLRIPKCRPLVVRGMSRRCAYPGKVRGASHCGPWAGLPGPLPSRGLGREGVD